MILTEWGLERRRNVAGASSGPYHRGRALVFDCRGHGGVERGTGVSRSPMAMKMRHKLLQTGWVRSWPSHGDHLAVRFSLSPQSLMAITAGTRIMLPSPNGARLSLACGDRPVFAGCLRNAAAVARAARQIASGGAVGVVPAGERWPDGSLRPAIEDLLGAGAIIHHLGLPCSPEAQVARDAFRSAGRDVERLIRASVSGCELIERGFADDVDIAVELEVSHSAPRLIGGAYRVV